MHSLTNTVNPVRASYGYRSRSFPFLLLLGLYYPTAAGGSYTLLSVASFLICLGLLATLIFTSPAKNDVRVMILLLSIVPLLFVFTATSPLPTLKLGASVGYGVLSVLLLTSVRDIKVQRWHHRLWIIVNVINLAAGIGILMGIGAIDGLIIKYYSFSYQEMVPNMMIFHKPVVTFGTHSVAGFFWYLFFWINLEGYRLARKRSLMVLSICYLLLTLSLLSVTGLVLFCLGSIQLLGVTWMTARHRFLLATAGVVLVVTTLFWGVKINWKDIFESAMQILKNPEGGLMARYLPGGTMYPNLEYLNVHPFLPVGFSYKADLLVGDSGIVEYLMRGSLPLLLLIYGGLYYFLRRNLWSKAQAYFLFFAFLFFEIGITTLIYIRTLLLLPAFVIYLNSFQQEQKEQPKSASWMAR